MWTYSELEFPKCNLSGQECDCTSAGASTYYATCKKMYESGVL